MFKRDQEKELIPTVARIATQWLPPQLFVLVLPLALDIYCIYSLTAILNFNIGIFVGMHFVRYCAYLFSLLIVKIKVAYNGEQSRIYYTL